MSVLKNSKPICINEVPVAHIRNNDDGIKVESLAEHTELVVEYYQSFIELEHIDKCLKSMISSGEWSIVLYLMKKAVKYHDYGKISPIFQNKINNRPTGGKDSGHSYLSAIMYMEKMTTFIKSSSKCKELGENKMLSIMHLFANNIKGHHTSIDSIYRKERRKTTPHFYNKLNEYETNIRMKLEELQSFVGEDYILPNFNAEVKELDKRYFYLGKLHYSLLINSDFLATTAFFNDYDQRTQSAKDVVRNLFLSKNTMDSVREYYEQTPLMSSIRQKKIASEMNILRTEIFLEVEKNFLKRPFEKIYYLTSPAGSGKTNIGFNVALLIAEYQKKSKIVQVLPLNAVGEQSFDFIQSMLEHTEVNAELINSSGIYTSELDVERTTEWYDVYHLHRQMLGFNYIVTSHVRLFDSLFSSNRIRNLPLLHLCNSVIIIDEIQAYSENKWQEIAYALNDVAEFFNITFVIMSATMVYLNQFLQKESYDLLENKSHYLTHPIFKNRFEVDDSYLNKVNTITDVVDMVNKINQKDKRILIEVETKKKAYELYRLINENVLKDNVMLLTSDENRFARNVIIQALKKENDNGDFLLKDVVLIATSVIEYGVDIDFDIGIKQVTALDAEEQFGGRINRSNKRSGVLYLIDLDDAMRSHLRSGYRYRLDNRFALYKLSNNDKQLEALREKKIDELYTSIINCINDEKLPELLTIYKNKDYNNLEECMKLIEENDYQETYFIPYIDSHNNQSLDGYVVYSEYLQLLTNLTLGYGEKKIKLLENRSKMEPFLFKVNKKTAQKLGLKKRDEEENKPFYYSERSDLLEDVVILNAKYKRLKTLV
ncbi:CRISPR-associated helicase Cas3' [Priestia megaterium]|uniref:CRISPR-associated helicase Cas3 n=1 Tax=Priestia megaterium TaxID=1404 RepID=A0A6M6E8M2_PRIMG|nr:CRISPR-associated helicase Cas3' [Priestia megaterium]QJX79935.1 CRISPR-associated helicase Cas3' [Priestia megaterium]